MESLLREPKSGMTLIQNAIIISSVKNAARFLILRLNVLIQKERKVSYPDTESMKYTDTSRVSVKIALRMWGKIPEEEVLLDV